MTEYDGVYGKPLAIGTKVRWFPPAEGPIETEVAGYWTVDIGYDTHPLSVGFPYRLRDADRQNNYLASPRELEVLND